MPKNRNHQKKGKRQTGKFPNINVPTLIGKNSLVKGSIAHAGMLSVEGTVEGNISDACNLIIGESGIVNGDIHAQKIVVFGNVNGNIWALESIEIKNTGKVNGVIDANSLSLESGAIYSGKINICRMSLDTNHRGIRYNESKSEI